MDVWEWYLDGSNAAKVAKLCARINGQDQDEAYGKAIDAMITHGQTWLDKYDASRASLNTYMLMQIGFALRSKAENKERFLTDQESESLTYTNSELEPDEIPEEKLLAVLNHLSGYDKWLITARHVYKLSFSMIGANCGVSKGLVREHYIRAMNRAKRYL
jgi:DNA-directed RNA polymerase specialized sigma24 family protein